MAPGDGISSLGAEGKPLTLGGTSVAAPFVTGTIALLWSEVPGAPATEVRLAIAQSYSTRRATVVPPLLDAWAAYQMMTKTRYDSGVVRQRNLVHGGEHDEREGAKGCSCVQA